MVQAVCDQLAAHRLERKSFIVALGGGVVGDLAGFLAAIYLRGIPFVQVPTTLLAQVDSSVGGKVGVNLKGRQEPGRRLSSAPFCPVRFATLDSLPLREFRAGLAEVIKYGIIADAPVFLRGWNATCPGCCAARPRFWARWWPAAANSRPGSSVRMKPKPAFAPSSISATPSATPSRTSPATENIFTARPSPSGRLPPPDFPFELAGLPPGDAARIEKLFRAAGLPAAITLSAAARWRLLAAMQTG